MVIKHSFKSKYPAEIKMEVIEYALANPKKTPKEVSEHFKNKFEIHPSAVWDWRRQEKFKSTPAGLVTSVMNKVSVAVRKNDFSQSPAARESVQVCDQCAYLRATLEEKEKFITQLKSLLKISL